MSLNPGLLALEANLEAYGKPVDYLSPDETVELKGLVGLRFREPIALSGDAEDTGGIVQTRDVLRLLAAGFPDGVEPEQGALVEVDGERSLVMDVRSDPAGWFDLPLAAAPG